jgi:hypothetical protein
MQVAHVYPSGELTVSKVLEGSASKPPVPQFGARMVTGHSRRGARAMRRAIMARSQWPGGAQFVMLTLTSQAPRSDWEMRAAFARFVAWGRKFVPAWFEWYVWAAEDQARGVLHYHLVVAKRIPKALWDRARTLWCDTYGMGPGSFHRTSMRSAKGAAKYLAKYLSKPPRTSRVTLDGEGALVFRPWRVSRHTGEAYVRDRFRGNPYGMSDSARYATRPHTTFRAALGAFVGLDGWHGTVHFARNVDEALAMLAAALARDGPSSQLGSV